MNTQELRLGNIVDYNDLFFQVAELKLGGVKFVGDGRWTGAALLKPVKITQDILERLGWVERNYDFTHPLYDSYKLVLASDDEGGYSLLMESETEQINLCIMTDIKNLHTLQNIFYLLCSGDMDTEKLNVQNISKRVEY